MRTFSNDIRRGNMDTRHPCKEQASSRKNKDGKEYVKHHMPGQKNNRLGKRKDQGHRQVRRRKWTWAGHVSRIQDNRWTLRITTWKPYERKRPRGRPARRWRDELVRKVTRSMLRTSPNPGTLRLKLWLKMLNQTFRVNYN